jgi:hypothetical protein
MRILTFKSIKIALSNNTGEIKYDFKISGLHRTYPPCSTLVKSRIVLTDVLFELVRWGQVAGDAGESLSYTTARLVLIAWRFHKTAHLSLANVT